MALDQGGVEQRRVQPESCVVDQDIDRIGIRLQARRDLQHLVTDGKVGGQHLHRDAMHLGQLGGGGLQAFPVPGDEHQVVSTGGQLLGEGVADAGGRSRDQCSCHGGNAIPPCQVVESTPPASSGSNKTGGSGLWLSLPESHFVR